MKRTTLAIAMGMVLALSTACTHHHGGPGGSGCREHRGCKCNCGKQHECPKPDCPTRPDCPQQQAPAVK